MSIRNDTVEAHYRENYSRLVKKMAWRVPNRSLALAEEVVQESYSRALKYFRTFNPEIKDFEVWFGMIMNNSLKVCKKEEGNGGAVEVSEDLVDQYIPTREEREHYTDIVDRIKDKSKTDREILTMFFLLGFKSREIAEYVTKSHTNIRQIILRFRNSLKDEVS